MKSRKVLVIQGGGRPRGNACQLAQAFMKGVREAGHETEYVSLNKSVVNGCLGCNACRYEKPCIQKDDFSEAAAMMREADCLAFASPLLFWTISSRLKALIERFYCLAKEDPNSGKSSIIIIMTDGGSAPYIRATYWQISSACF